MFAHSASLVATSLAVDDIVVTVVVRRELVVVVWIKWTNDLMGPNKQSSNSDQKRPNQLRASGFGPKRGILLHPGIRNSNINISFDLWL